MTTRNNNEFEFHTVAEVNLGTGRHWRVSLTFLKSDFTKPVSVTFSERDSGQMVSIPAELWPAIAERVEDEWVQGGAA